MIPIKSDLFDTMLIRSSPTPATANVTLDVTGAVVTPSEANLDTRLMAQPRRTDVHVDQIRLAQYDMTAGSPYRERPRNRPAISDGSSAWRIGGSDL